MRVLSPVGVTKYVETKDELAVRPERLTGKEYQVRIKELLMEHEPDHTQGG